MSIIILPRKAPPSYKTGFARSASESAHPGLWDGLKHCYAYGLGVTGEVLKDVVGDYRVDLSGSNPGPPTWEINEHGRVLKTPANTAWTGPLAVGSGVFPYDYSGITSVVVAFTMPTVPITNAQVLVNTTISEGLNFAINATQIRTTWNGLSNPWRFDSVTWNAGSRYLICSSWDGGNKRNRIIEDGVLVFDGSSATTGTVTASTTSLTLYNDTGQSEVPDAEYEYTSWHNRALSTQEIKLLHADPLAPFRLKSRTLPYAPVTTATKLIPARSSRSKPSYKTGFAKNAAESLFPNLWRGLRGAWVPALGVSGISRLPDVSGSNDGVMTSIASSDWAIGEKGYALDYDGINDYITVGDIGVDFHAQNQSFSAVAWIKTSVNSSSNYIVVTGIDDGWYMRAGNGTTESGLICKIDDGVDAEFTWSTTSVTDDKWHQVVLTLQASGAFLGYVDAVEEITLTAGSVDNLANSISIGQDDVAFQRFTGLIGPVSIYNRVLSPQEIKILHADPLAPFRLRPQLIPYKADVGFRTQRQAIIDGLDGDLVTVTSWDSVRDSIDVTDVERISDTQVSITLPALPSYDITEQETVQATLPASALVLTDTPLGAPPVFMVDAVGTGGNKAITGGATSTATGDATIAQTFAVDGNASSTTSGDADITFVVEGNASSTTSGDATIAQTFAVDGNAISTASGSADITSGVDGNASSTTSGDATIAQTFAVDGNASSAASGDATIAQTFAVDGNVTSTATGSADITFGVDGNASSTTSGDATIAQTFAIDGNASSTASGDATVTSGLVGNASSAASGDATIAQTLAVDGNVASIASGDATIARTLAIGADSTSAVTGSVSVVKVIPISADATSTATADANVAYGVDGGATSITTGDAVIVLVQSVVGNANAITSVSGSTTRLRAIISNAITAASAVGTVTGGSDVVFKSHTTLNVGKIRATTHSVKNVSRVLNISKS